MQRQQVIEDRKYSFFYFAGVRRSADQNYFFGEVNNGKIMLSCSIDFRDCKKSRRLDDSPTCVMIGCSMVFIRSDKHVVAKQVSPRCFSDDTKGNCIFRMCAGSTISDPDWLILKVRADLSIKHIEVFALNRNIKLIPMNSIFSE